PLPVPTALLDPTAVAFVRLDAAAAATRLRSDSPPAHAAPRGLSGRAMTSVQTETRLAIHGGEPVRRRPFAEPCFIGGRERELLLEALESCSWSACRAGAQGIEVGALCEMPSADAAAFDDREVLFLGARWLRRLEA